MSLFAEPMDFVLLDLVPFSPSMDDSSSSREATPNEVNRMPGKPAAPIVQTSPFLRLPDDVFKCIMDYVGRQTAWSLKRLCRGMNDSKTVNRLLYKYPIHSAEVRDIRLRDWKYRSLGHMRWINFKESIDDSNRYYVQKLAMSHWASIDDFKWVEENLPSLTSLDLSGVKDFVWTPEETWTWKMLAEACPKLFGRLEELDVANWADYTAHSRIEYSYSYNDYRFKQKFRMSRRRDGGSIAKMIFPICHKLKALAIRERYSGFHTWNEWEVHQRVCCLVDGIQQCCSQSLTKLRIHDYAPYRALFSTELMPWTHLTDVEIGLYRWMEDRQDRETIGPVSYRITQGHHHRDEEEVFDDKTYDTCKRDHMSLGNHVVQGIGASFEDLLQSVQSIAKMYPTINIRPIQHTQKITLHPFNFVNIVQRRSHFGTFNGHLNGTLNSASTLTLRDQIDPVSIQAVQDALRWLAEKCEWKPVLAWDSMMCDVFPANLESNRTFLPKPDAFARIKSMVSTLRSLGIPIRISIGDRSNTCTSSGLDGSLYFGDYKTIIGEGPKQRELLLPTQAAFNLTPIASMVDELTIQYPVDVPGVSGWLSVSKRPTPAETALMQREMRGWRRFWARYACQFTNLKKLTANVPNDIFQDWAHSDLATLLDHPQWQMLEVDEERGADYGFFGSYFPFSAGSMRYGFGGKRKGRTKFAQRVFFRLDEAPLVVRPNLGLVWSEEMSELERDEMPIPDEAVADLNVGTHRYWPGQGSRKDEGEKANGKRRRGDEGEGVNGHVETKKRKIVKAEAET